MLKKAPHISKNYCKKYQTSQNGLLQRLSNKLLYRRVAIVGSQPDSRQSILDSSRIDACWLLRCSQLLLETVNFCLQRLRQVVIRDSLLAYDYQLLTNPFHEDTTRCRIP